MNYLEKLKPLALLVLRCVLGVIFIYHGFPKLFGQTQRFVEAFAGLGLPAYMVYVVGIVESFGGCLLVVGLFTRGAALLLTADMAGALWKYNLSEGLLAVREYELPLALGAATLALVAVGAGIISLDHVIFRKKVKARRSP